MDSCNIEIFEDNSIIDINVITKKYKILITMTKKNWMKKCSFGRVTKTFEVIKKRRLWIKITIILQYQFFYQKEEKRKYTYFKFYYDKKKLLYKKVMQIFVFLK